MLLYMYHYILPFPALQCPEHYKGTSLCYKVGHFRVCLLIYIEESFKHYVHYFSALNITMECLYVLVCNRRPFQSSSVNAMHIKT